MKKLCIGSVLVILLGMASLAQSGIDAQGVASGKTVLWFYGTEVTALIESDFSLDGSLEIDGTVIPFTASGTAFGEGVGNTATMTLGVWLIIEAEGTTEGGEPISLRGGLAGSSDDTDLSANAFGSATGPFFFIVTLESSSFLVTGTGEGSAAGAFVVPDDPLTMQMEGTGTYTLIGNLITNDVPSGEEVDQPSYTSYLPWDLESWPEELLTRLLALLSGMSCEEGEEPNEETGEA